METIGIVDILGKMNEYSGAGGVRDTINVMVINVECKFSRNYSGCLYFRDVPLNEKTSLPESLKYSFFANFGAMCILMLYLKVVRNMFILSVV